MEHIVADSSARTWADWSNGFKRFAVWYATGEPATVFQANEDGLYSMSPIADRITRLDNQEENIKP
jgi:hypothetical protein